MSADGLIVCSALFRSKTDQRITHTHTHT
jgi:hypothetical protein